MSSVAAERRQAWTSDVHVVADCQPHPLDAAHGVPDDHQDYESHENSSALCPPGSVEYRYAPDNVGDLVNQELNQASTLHHELHEVDDGEENKSNLLNSDVNLENRRFTAVRNEDHSKRCDSHDDQEDDLEHVRKRYY